MRFTLVFLPGGRKRKYEGKIARARWKEMKAQRREAGRSRITGAHDCPWWREPTLASLIGRWRKQ